MNVLFITPFLGKKKTLLQAPLGICYLSSNLKKYSHRTRLFFINPDFNYKHLDTVIGNFEPGVILISAVTYEMEVCKKTVSYLDNKYKIPIFFGGVHVTLMPEQSIKIKGVAGVCVGEGEDSVIQLVNSLEKGESIERIPGIWIKKGIKTIRNPPGKLGDINKLPFPDRSLFEEHNFDSEQIPLLASRGCPYSCTMCSNSLIRHTYKNKGCYYRVREVKNIIAESELIKRKYDRHVLFFANDKFPLYSPWLKEFSKQYKTRVGTPFKCKLSLREVKEGKIKLLKEAGCIQVKVGVESGDKKMLNLIKKGVSLGSILKTCQIIKSQGIKLFCWYMIGLPYETEQSIRNTIDLHKKVRPDAAVISTFVPLPNTQLFALCVKEKFIDTYKPSNYEGGSVLRLPSITNEKLLFYKEYLITLSQIPFSAPLFYILFKLNIRNKLIYDIICFFRKMLYAIKLRVPYNFYRKYSLQN